MAKGSKLKAALDHHKGVDHKLERQKKLQKEAAKRKKSKSGKDVDTDVLDAAAGAEEIADARKASKKSAKALGKQKQKEPAAVQVEETAEADGWETDESEDAEDDDEEEGGIDLEAMLEDDSDSDSEDEQLFAMDVDKPNGHSKVPADDEDNDDEDEEDIPLSDIASLASDDRADVIPHQRLTINNTAALTRSLKSFALPSSLPFSAAQAVTSVEPTKIDDVEDDLSRELAFYKQSLEAVKEARIQLKKEGVAFTRPADYFAEMVKSEEQMGKVRSKMLDEAARKKASADARRQRDLKKFGKAVQVAKLQERDKKKRETLDKINVLKRKRAGGNDLNTNEGDMFDVALEDAAETDKKDRAARKASGARDGGRNAKRQKKDEKFGSGGKRRFKKSNDAQSAGDMRGFSAKKMKAGSKSQRPGKSRRAAGRK